jgi:hypothetical protein
MRTKSLIYRDFFALYVYYETVDIINAGFSHAVWL